MRVWIKPNGTELTINSDSEDVAREMGWKPKGQFEVAKAVQVNPVESAILAAKSRPKLVVRK